MVTYVIDCEGDSLIPTKIHCLSYTSDGVSFKSLTSYERMKKFLSQKDLTLVCHNVVMFDKPVLERILGVKIKARIVDSWALSQYLYPTRRLHGLEAWGEEFGIHKPEVTDWVGLKLMDYIRRCKEDVKINWTLWVKQREYLKTLYDTEEPEGLPIIHYLTFKLECAVLARSNKVRLNVPHCLTLLAELETAKEGKEAVLRESMPRKIKREPVNRPAKCYKKNGDVSEAGKKWFALLEEHGLGKDHSFPIMVIKSSEDANPSSPEQVKDWLFSLGWEPIRFEVNKKTQREVPQIKKEKNEPELCPSVLELAEKEPTIVELEGLSIINHRLGMVKSFLENKDEDGFVAADIQGFTNTLRFKHRKPLVNLPGVDKPYGKQLRGCLLSREGHIFIGSDMVALEDNTKKHYIQPHDPEYVKAMSTPGYDAHLDLAVIAKEITFEQMEEHKAKKADYGKIRKIFKVVNYSSLYGIGPPKLAKDLKATVAFARKLLKAYWQRNWAVRKVSDECYVKTVNGQMWLLNPVSKMFYSLRYDKDRFSTLNQGTATFVFDNWVREVIKRRKQLTFQMHDEILIEVKEEEADEVEHFLFDAIKAVNDRMKLNVEFAVDAKRGQSYADCH